MMTGKKSGLGRGLDALFPEKTVQSKPKTTVKTAKQTKTATLKQINPVSTKTAMARE